MKSDFLKPNPTFAKKLSFEFTEKLKSSLLYLLHYFEEYVDCQIFLEAKVAIEGISDKHPDYWYICAINRRLCDLAIKKRGSDASFYFTQLCSLKTYNTKLPLTTINNFNRIQRSLFTFYSTELSSNDKNIFHLVTEQEYLESKKILHLAFEILSEQAPDFYKEYENLVNSLIIYKSDQLSSGTTFSLGKCIYLKSAEKCNKRNIFVAIDRIIHETAHLLLHLLSNNDPFVLNPTQKLFYSPFRADPRPMIGIFHAHFVLFRLTMAFSLPSLRKEFEDIGISEASIKYKAAFEDTKVILSRHGDFTKLGQDIFNGTVSLSESA